MLQQDAQGAKEGGGKLGGKQKHLTDDERNVVLQALLVRSDGCQNLNFGAIAAVAKEFSTTRQTDKKHLEARIREPCQWVPP